MTPRRKAHIVASLLAGAGMALPALAGAQSLTFYACQKDGKVIPGQILVGSKPTCNGGATLVSWAQGSNVRVLGGAVSSNGDVIGGQGFTVVKDYAPVTQYRVTIKPGKLKAGVPAEMIVTPIGVAPYVTNPLVMGIKELADGSREFTVWMSLPASSPAAVDAAFMFVVVQN